MQVPTVIQARRVPIDLARQALTGLRVAQAHLGPVAARPVVSAMAVLMAAVRVVVSAEEVRLCHRHAAVRSAVAAVQRCLQRAAVRSAVEEAVSVRRHVPAVAVPSVAVVAVALPADHSVAAGVAVKSRSTMRRQG